ncbi:MAG: EcsC family protein [Microbacterium sp.]|uniref:EcsC family protein n=1 Tax=Microbacterium sp. TaxID=51671 RepID=UPI0039E3BF0E
MSEPSEYELEAWRAVQQFKGRPLGRWSRDAGQWVADHATAIGQGVEQSLEKHPRAQAAVKTTQGAVVRTGQAIGTGAKKAAEALPSWAGEGTDAVGKLLARASRIGLTKSVVVKQHQKRGHDVEELHHIRHLDLKQVDRVRGRGLTWYYPVAAALSGAGAGLVTTGGTLAITASGGAAAAPSAGVVLSAFAVDIAWVLGISSRAVGRVSLYYGYDPEDAAEKLFIMAVVNAGTAMSASAKTAAMADLSKLTQALFRGKTWAVLNESIVSKVAWEFSKRFGFRLTKQGLSKVVPAAGILLGGAFNWTTLEAIVDAADAAYRRRFLLEKYPQLAQQETATAFSTDIVIDAQDETISVIEELEEAGAGEIFMDDEPDAEAFGRADQG